MFAGMLEGLGATDKQTPAPAPAKKPAPTIVRQNNGGAIEDGAFARSQPGYVPPKPGERRRFAAFATPEAGRAAQVALLGTEGYANKSVNQVIDRYLGTGSENSPSSQANYKGYVAARLGIGPNDPVPPEKREMLAQAQHEFETGQRDPNVKFTPVSDSGSNTPYKAPIQTPEPVDVTGIQPSAPEVAQMDGQKFEISDPFAVGPKLKTQQETVETRGADADSVLSNTIAGLQSIQDQRETALAQTLTAKQAVSNEMRDETTHIIDEAKPLFQQREAISQRRLDLTRMNPFQRFLKGTFDPNYNDKDLEGRDRALATHLNVLNEDHTMLTGLQDNLSKLIDTDYNGQESMFKLQRDNLTEDFTLSSQSFAMSQQVMGASMNGLEASTAVLRAQQLGRTDALSRMSIGQVNVAIDQAKKSTNGYAVVNGIPLGLGELKQVQDNYRDQAMALSSRQLALESGRLGLAGQYEDQAIAHMTPPQIEEAVKNGGQYNGQQLDMGKLTQAYGSVQARNAAQAENVAQQGAPGVMRNLIGGVRNQTVGTSQRMIGMMGAVPQEQQQLMGAVSSEIASIAEGFQQADAQGVGAQYAAQNLPRLQALYKQQDEMITKTAQRWAGGNKEVQAVGEAWLRGTPVSGDVAVRGMIQMARVGVPAGTKLSGPAAQTMRLVAQVVKEFDTPKAGQSLEQLMGTPENQKQRDRDLQARVQGVVGEAYTNAMTDSVLKAAPQIAQHIPMAHGGKHFFTQVNPQDFANAISYGDNDGFTRLATATKAQVGVDVGLDVPTLQKIFSEGVNGPTWAATAKAKGWDNSTFEKLGQLLVSMQTQSTMQALDASSSAKPGFRPSAAFADLMQNQEFQSQAMGIVNGTNQGSFGDYLASGVAGPGFAEKFQGYANTVQQAYTTYQASAMRARIQASGQMNATGRDKARNVLAGMEGLSRNDVDTLLNAATPYVRPSPRITDRPGIDDHDNADFGEIQNVIMNHKFDDPAIERIRQRAMKQWIQTSAVIDRIQAHNSGVA